MPRHRERLGTALVRTGADLRLNRLELIRRIEDGPPGPGRDLALAQLRYAAWVDTVLLWVGWRLCPSDSLTGI